MNPQHGKHMTEGEHGDEKDAKDAKDVHKQTGQHHAPSIHIHSHAKGHTVHIMHQDGGHEKHEHAHGDADGIAQHVHDHLGGGEGQTHGEDSGMGGELEELGV